MTIDSCGFWSPDGCEGTPECPPRCPRFVDKHGVPYQILPIEDADLEPTAAMYRTFDPQHRSLSLPPESEPAISEWLARLHDRGRNFVAWRDDRVVGHAGFTPTDADVPEFLVFVHQDFHGRGLGTELTKHAVAYAAEAGHEGLVLDVEASNEAAVAVYRKLGFETVARHAMELEMRLSFSDPIAETVRLAPAARA